MAYQNAAGVWLAESGRPQTEIWGTGGNDVLYGTSQNDSIIPNGGYWDIMSGGAGDDTYWGFGEIIEKPGEGIDLIRSWASVILPDNVENAMVFGNGSYVVGNSMNNIIQGLEGDQFLYGGRGQNVLIGGAGKDTFVIVKGEGANVIQDFEAWGGHGDVVRLAGSNFHTFDQVKGAMTQQGSDVVLNNGGESLVFRNISVGQFSDKDFQVPMDYSKLGSLTFSEDFNSLTLNNPATGAPGWVPHLGFGGEQYLGSFNLGNNGEEQVYVSPRFQGTAGHNLGLNPFSINDGVLTIKAQPVDQNLANQMWGKHYTSGAITTQDMFAQKYGYFEMRADLPEGKGLWPAFWMIRPGNAVELDVLEALGSEPHVFLNATHSQSLGDNLVKNFNPNPEGFHTYGVMWTASKLTFYLDGVPVREMATPAEMHEPLYMIVNLAVGGNWAGSPDANTPWPAEFKIDYVRAYNLPGDGTAPPPTPNPSPPPPPAPGGALIQGDNGAAVTGSAGSDVIVAGRGGGTLAGGGGADTFTFQSLPWAAGRIDDFTVGVDKLDISALYAASGYSGSDPVADRYLMLRSDGAGGTRVYYDSDGPSGGEWETFLTVLANVAPTTSAASLFNSGGGQNPGPPPGGGQTLIQGDNGAPVMGSAGSDEIVAGRGGGSLTGGAGADTFVFDKLPWAHGRITDFTVGVDKLDISALVAASGYSGNDLIADRHLILTSDGAGGTRVYFDTDGPWRGEWETFLTVLENVSPTSLSNSWLV